MGGQSGDKGPIEGPVLWGAVRRHGPVLWGQSGDMNLLKDLFCGGAGKRRGSVGRGCSVGVSQETWAY